MVLNCHLAAFCTIHLDFKKRPNDNLIQVTRWNMSQHLQRFCPSFVSSILLPGRSQRLNISQPFLLASSITTTSLDLFRRSFLGYATIDNIRVPWIGNAHKNFLTILVMVRQFVSILFVFTPAAVLVLVVNFHLLNHVWEYPQ